MMCSKLFSFCSALASISQVEPEDLGEGFTFGELVSIEIDLRGIMG